MNPTTQPDRHPDAEILNAFVEHALRDPERAQVVAHMGECARCREVVFLARAAAEAEAPPLADIKPEPRPGRIALALAKWRVALIPAAALAATGAVVLWVQLRPAPPRAEMAQTAPLPARPMTAPSAAPTAHQTSAPAATPLPAPSPAHRSTPSEQRPERKNVQPVSPALAGTGFSGSAPMARNQAVPAATAPIGSSRVVGGYHLDAHSAAMARQPAPPEQPNDSADMAYKPALTNGLLQPPGTASMTPAARRGATAGKAAPAPVPPNILAVQGANAVPVSDGPEPLTLQVEPSSVQLAPQPLNGLAVMQVARHAKLPSGLNTVSSAAMLNTLLAVDSAGALFFSQDAGKHWEAVRPQWRGKAIAVQAPPQGLYQLTPAAAAESLDRASIVAPAAQEKRARPNVNAAVSSPPPPPPAHVSGPAVTATGVDPSIPAVLFKLITDRHQTWISADGKVWREQ